MRTLTWPQGFFPGKEHFDELQAAPEDAIKTLAKDTVGIGIADGLALSIAGTTVTAASGSGWDSRGRRVAGTAPMTLDLSSGITRPDAGQFKWVSIYAQFMRVESGEVFNIDNVKSTYYSDDGAKLVAVEGAAAATRAAAVRPTVTGDVLLGDFLVDHDSPWTSFATDSTRTTGITANAQVQATVDATFPIGTIWMYDGATWQDNVTLPGWYACVPENEDGGSAGLSYGITSMVDRFAMGRPVAGSNTTGGSNSYRLTAAQLPGHTHTINHDHPSFQSGNQRQNHRHHLALDSNTTGSHVHSLQGRYSSGGTSTGAAIHQMSTGRRGLASGMVGTAGNHSHHTSGWTGWISSGHNHDIDIPAYTGNSGSTGLGAAVDNRPAFYSMIFVRKCV